MSDDKRRAATMDRIATGVTAAVAAIILATFALTAKSTTQATLAETTAAMAYAVGPLVSKAVGSISLSPRSTTTTGR